METPPALATLVFSLVYFIFATILTVTSDHKGLLSDRYYVVIQTPILIFLFITIEKLVIPHIKLERRFLEYGLIGIFALWSVYPLYNLQAYVRTYRQDGEPSYDIYNKRIVRENQTLQKALVLIRDEPGSRFYSNFPAALWLYSRQQQRDSLPSRWDYKSMDDVKERLAGWPGAKTGYIVWFLPDVLEFFVPPESLSEVANLKLVYQGPDGEIYYASPRPAP
jgi:hypothetical protein